jgi:uncharacterized protein YjiS (DUF1127 family)
LAPFHHRKTLAPSPVWVGCPNIEGPGIKQSHMIGWVAPLACGLLNRHPMQRKFDMRSLEQWREKRRDQKSYIELQGLSAHLLADIGIGPDEMDRLRRGEPLCR